jgi:hypothetical protein
MHLSCTDTNTVFKWTKTRFHMTHVTLEFQQVRPKWFLRLWYIRHKPCTYLASRLALYQMNWIKHPVELCHLGVQSGASKTISDPTVCSAQTMHLSCVKISTISNELNQASSWASSPRSTIGCVQNDFWAYGIFSTNHAPILHRHQHYLQIDQNEIPHDPHHLGVSSDAYKTISEVVVRSAQTVHLSCVKISNIFQRSGSSFHLSLVT